MRSELVFTAKTSIPNRYQLCSSVAAATRKLHREGSSFSESINRGNDLLCRTSDFAAAASDQSLRNTHSGKNKAPSSGVVFDPDRSLFQLRSVAACLWEV